MRSELRPDLIVWTPDRPESHPRLWKAWQERKNAWGTGWSAVPGTVKNWPQRPTDKALLALPQTKNHRWVVGPA